MTHNLELTGAKRPVRNEMTNEVEQVVMCQCAARSENECCCEGVDWRSEREKKLETLVSELVAYVTHDSWRCEKYHECHCGLDALMDSAGMDRIPC